MGSHADVSYWLESSGDDLAPRAPLDGSTRADIAILGAGYTGLWTAYALLCRDPSLRVVIVEREIAGYGASGRNGGWCSCETGASPSLLARRFGRERARAVHDAMVDAVDDVGRVAQAEDIDIAYRRGGQLQVARGEGQLPSLREEHAARTRAGVGDAWELLDAGALRDRIDVAGGLGALYTPHCAVVHPGRLVRGLARVVERMGATIVEQTPVTGWTCGASPRLHTPRGHVHAATLVLAGEAYLSQLPPTRRDLLPVYSLIVLTEPIEAERWNAIGWRAHECMASMRLTVDYLSRTEDGRVLVGGRGAPYALGSAMTERLARHAPTHAMLRAMLTAWFPALRGVRFTHAWGGAVGIPRDFIPTVRLDRRAGVAAAHGYTGHGVAFANLAGRTLADLICGVATERTQLPFVNRRTRRWEPEPLRWIGVRGVQRGLARVDARRTRGARTRRHSLVERIAAH